MTEPKLPPGYTYEINETYGKGQISVCTFFEGVVVGPFPIERACSLAWEGFTRLTGITRERFQQMESDHEEMEAVRCIEFPQRVQERFHRMERDHMAMEAFRALSETGGIDVLSEGREDGRYWVVARYEGGGSEVLSKHDDICQALIEARERREASSEGK